MYLATVTLAAGMSVTLGYFVPSFRRGLFAGHSVYPEQPVPVRPRSRGFHRFDLTTCIGFDTRARAGPVNGIDIEKGKAPPPVEGSP